MFCLFKKHNTLHKYQFGFRVKHGTSYALIVPTDKIATAISAGDLVLGIFLDFNKTFDTVDNSTLLNKLYKYSMGGIAHDWLKSYLYNRRHLVSFNNHCSDMNDINCGVHQVSILGPLLFLLYVNDIVEVLSDLILYADDTSLLFNWKEH